MLRFLHLLLGIVVLLCNARAVMADNSATVRMGFLLNILRRHEMIRTLALRDFQSRYAATVAGSLWTLLHPVAIVAVFYFVFAVGFKAKGPDSTPFIVWFRISVGSWASRRQRSTGGKSFTRTWASRNSRNCASFGTRTRA